MSLPVAGSGIPPSSGDVYRGDLIVGFTVVLFVIASLTVISRFLVRWHFTRQLGWDDWFILAAMAGVFVGVCLDFLQVHNGFGRHIYYLDEHRLRKYLQMAWGNWIQTFWTLTFTKVSICFFLMRIPLRKAYIRPLQAAIAFLLISNLVLTILWIVQCKPVHAAWDDKAGGTCFPKAFSLDIILTQAIISIVSDFALSLYPVFVLWHVRIRFKDKIGIYVLMGLGVITGICSIMRTTMYKQSIPHDATYDSITNWIWRTFEVKLGIVTACLPTLVPGWRWIKAKASPRVRSVEEIFNYVQPPTPRGRGEKRFTSERLDSRLSIQTYETHETKDTAPSATTYIYSPTSMISPCHVTTPYSRGDVERGIRQTIHWGMESPSMPTVPPAALQELLHPSPIPKELLPSRPISHLRPDSRPLSSAVSSLRSVSVSEAKSSLDLRPSFGNYKDKASVMAGSYGADWSRMSPT